MPVAPNRSWTHAREIRIAYLVERSEQSHPILDAIFERSFGHWGGRFSLIVPSDRSGPLAEYNEWLQIYDPDIIYSYVELHDTAVDLINEQLYPSYIILHSEPSDQPPRFTPQLPLKPLHINSLIPLENAKLALPKEQPLSILNATDSFRGSFLKDSFGFYERSAEQLLPAFLKPYATVETLCKREEVERLQQARGWQGATVADEVDAVRFFADCATGKSLSQLSSASTQRIEMQHHRFASSFNLVVGSTFEDRLFYWNSRHLYPRWRDGDFVDLRVSDKDLANPELLEAIRVLLSKRTNVGNENTPRVTLRSSSLEEAYLQEVVSKFAAKPTWVDFTCEKFSSADECIPTAREFHQARGEYHLALTGTRLGSESTSEGDEIRVSAPQPDHLRFAPQTLHSPNIGCWALDIDIEKSSALSYTERWRLPRRLRLAHHILSPYRLTTPFGTLAEPRVSYGGRLTAFTAIGTRIPGLELPTDELAIVAGLQGGPNYPMHPLVERATVKEQSCQWAGRSNNGSYFWGVHQLFGSVDAARKFLGHKFWRDQIYEMGGSDKRLAGRINDVKGQLKKKFGGRMFDTASDTDLNAMADITLKTADLFRGKTPSVTWDVLRDAYAEYVEQHWEVYPESRPSLEQDNVYNASALSASVRSLCAIGVFHQGYNLTCTACYHRSWLSIDSLRAALRCEVCGVATSAPVDRPWSFRLNGFLQDALRLHGIEPLFWTLSQHHPDLSGSLWFSGPLDIGLDPTNLAKTSTDLDLVIVSEGKVHMCEVKASGRAFSDPLGFAETIKLLRPDIGTVAIMEPETNEIRSKFTVFESALSGTGIQPRLITFDEYRDLETWPSLGTFNG